MRTARIIGAGIAAAAMVLTMAAGCGPSLTPAVPPRPTPPTPRISSASGPDLDRAVAAYRGMWDAFVHAARTSDPDDPQLRQYASGAALSLIVQSLYLDRAAHKVTLGNVGLNPVVVAATPTEHPTTATIADCVNAEHWLVYRADGHLVDDTPGATHHTTATVTDTAAGWTVASFTLLAGGTC